MQRYFLYLAYDGTHYHGWQIQPNGVSVQEVVQKALATLLRKPVPVTIAKVAAKIALGYTLAG